MEPKLPLSCWQAFCMFSMRKYTLLSSTTFKYVSQFMRLVNEIDAIGQKREFKMSVACWRVHVLIYEIN